MAGDQTTQEAGRPGESRYDRRVRGINEDNATQRAREGEKRLKGLGSALQVALDARKRDRIDGLLAQQRIQPEARLDSTPLGRASEINRGIFATMDAKAQSDGGYFYRQGAGDYRAYVIKEPLARETVNGVKSPTSVAVMTIDGFMVASADSSDPRPIQLSGVSPEEGGYYRKTEKSPARLILNRQEYSVVPVTPDRKDDVAAAIKTSKDKAKPTATTLGAMSVTESLLDSL